MEQLQDDMQERKGKTTTNVFAKVPRSQRSAAMPVPDTRVTSSALATAPSAPVHPASASTPAPSTSTEAFRPWSYQDTTTRRSSLRVDLALCIFYELFGNLLPKGEKNV